jgi:hypothetical protein
VVPYIIPQLAMMEILYRPSGKFWGSETPTNSSKQVSAGEYCSFVKCEPDLMRFKTREGLDRCLRSGLSGVDDPQVVMKFCEL